MVTNDTAIAVLESWFVPLHSTPECSVFSPIALEEFDEQKYREFVGTLIQRRTDKGRKAGPVAIWRRDRLDDAERV